MPHRNGSRSGEAGFAVRTLVFFLLSATCMIPGKAAAVPFDSYPKILLHLRPVAQKNTCALGQLSDCRTALTSGGLSGPEGPFYFAYVLTARGSMPHVAGVQMGISYQNDAPLGQLDGQGVDIFGWTNCATLEFTSRGWPASGGGNLITWDTTTRCQTGDTGVAGYFYLGAYGPDRLSLIPRPVDHQAKLANCYSMETNLIPADLGWIDFSSGSLEAGCNPCNALCGGPNGPDIYPPGAVTLNLWSRTTTTIRVQWYEPDEDGANGIGRPCVEYDLRYSSSPLTEANFLSATQVLSMGTPSTPGNWRSRTVEGLLPSTTYHFALRSRDDAGLWSPISNSLEASTLFADDTTPPAAVTDLDVDDIDTTSVLLRWTAPGDDNSVGQATAYDLRYALTPITSASFGAASIAGGLPVPLPAGSSQTYLLTGLAENTRYYVAMRSADDRTNFSSLSNVVTAVTLSSVPPDTTPPVPDVTPPAAITDLSVTNLYSNTVTLEWTVPGDDSLAGRAAVYDLRRSTSPITSANFLSAPAVSGEPAPGLPGARQGMTLGGLAQSTRYYFAIRTGDEVPNWSTPSNTADALTRGGLGDPRLMLHVASPISKSACANGQLARCNDAVTKGDLATVGGGGPFYFVYLMGIEFGELAGLQCGIDYDQNRADGQGNHEAVDILGWTLCATMEFPSGAPRQWPRPGSGNLITWDVSNRCQTGATAVAGYFYMVAYSADILKITPRPADAVAKASSCAAVEKVIIPQFLGTARFSEGATLSGYNPCGAGQSIPVQHTTWSRIKTLARS